jgi:hypothetical protein
VSNQISEHKIAERGSRINGWACDGSLLLSPSLCVQTGCSSANEGGVPLAVAGLIISAVMLRSNIFGRGTAYVGILANGVGLVMYIRAAAAPAFEGSPFFGFFFVLSVMWFFLIARKLFQLGQAANGGAK